MNAIGLAAEGMFPGPTTPDMEVQTWIVYSAVPLGSALMCFRFLQVALSFAGTGELPHHDHGHVDGLEEEDEFHPHDAPLAHPASSTGSDKS